jgi:hypothetical protein
MMYCSPRGSTHLKLGMKHAQNPHGLNMLKSFCFLPYFLDLGHRTPTEIIEAATHCQSNGVFHETR